ncbi:MULTISPECIES: ATP-binding protein [Neorhizobium]|jgi:chemotaxis methyl-accepting protein methylase|uniref:ATP-binding protein n=1 Tax=Neorhizobium sp. T6_25 TaxID=2093833 RepID=UPI000CF8C0F8|nr:MULTISPECIES: ATP-binding protein [Neorhizobium]
MTVSARKFYSLSDNAAELALESAFFAQLKMRNGTFKLTRAARFRDVEIAIRPAITERASSLRQVLDVGVSTGLTTVELAQFLRKCAAPARVTATDLFIHAHIVEVGQTVAVFCDPEGWPLQYEFFGMAIRPWIRRLDYVTLAFIPRLLARAYLQPRLCRRIRAGLSRRVQMITRSLPQDGEITFIEDDIMIPSQHLRGKFDLVRAANILNRNYFSDDQLKTAIGNIHSYLRGPGALVLLTRTNRSQENAGTLFELKEDSSLAVVRRVGGGSEVEKLLLDFRQAEPVFPSATEVKE